MSQTELLFCDRCGTHVGDEIVLRLEAYQFDQSRMADLTSTEIVICAECSVGLHAYLTTGMASSSVN